MANLPLQLRLNTVCLSPQLFPPLKSPQVKFLTVGTQTLTAQQSLQQAQQCPHLHRAKHTDSMQQLHPQPSMQSLWLTAKFMQQFPLSTKQISQLPEQRIQISPLLLRQATPSKVGIPIPAHSISPMI